MTATVESPDAPSNDGHQLPGGVGTIAQMLMSIANQVPNGNCLSTLVIEAHGNETVVSTGGLNPPVLPPNIGRVEGDTDINPFNASRVGNRIKSALCLCKPCKIYLLSCHVGLGNIPQKLATATGCTVFAPKGFCHPNLGDPIASPIQPTDPHYPNYNPIGSCGRWGVCVPQ